MPLYIALLLFLLPIIGIYMLSYVLNKNTKAPDDLGEISKCSTCSSGSCPLAGSKTKEPIDTCELK